VFVSNYFLLSSTKIHPAVARRDSDASPEAEGRGTRPPLPPGRLNERARISRTAAVAPTGTGGPGRTDGACTVPTTATHVRDLGTRTRQTRNPDPPAGGVRRRDRFMGAA